MRFKLENSIIIFSLRRKNRFWVEEEGYEQGEHYHITYCINGLSWRVFKKKTLKGIFVENGGFIRLSKTK